MNTNSALFLMMTLLGIVVWILILELEGDNHV